mgnify:FL=1
MDAADDSNRSSLWAMMPQVRAERKPHSNVLNRVQTKMWHSKTPRLATACECSEVFGPKAALTFTAFDHGQMQKHASGADSFSH